MEYVEIFIIIGLFQEHNEHNDQDYYWPTIYRAGTTECQLLPVLIICWTPCFCLMICNFDEISLNLHSPIVIGVNSSFLISALNFVLF